MSERNEAILIDLSAVVHQVYHATVDDPNPNQCSIGVLDIIRRVAMGQPHVAICCDSPRSLRKEADPTYKANRPKEDRAPLYHQMDLVLDGLKHDGFPAWLVDGYEADDIINAAVRAALDIPDARVRIVTTDKDLLCLVGERVVVEKLDGTRYDEAAVKAKFGVPPWKMQDWLALVGDASDNIKGAYGIGPAKAAALLEVHGDLIAIHTAWMNEPAKFTPGVHKSLGEFWPRVDAVRALINLRTPEIPFAEIATERTPVPQMVQPSDLEDIMPNTPSEAAPLSTTTEPNGMGVKVAPSQPPQAVLDPVGPSVPPPDMALVRTPQVLSAAPQEWEKQLEPRSMDDARLLAKFAFESRLFGAYGSAQGVLMAVMAGRDFGMSAMASLRAFHIVEGRPTLAADAARSLVLRSGKAIYFRCTERTPERATFATKRGDDPEIALSFTIEEARAAWSRGDDKWKSSGWGKFPTDMLIARASIKLARLVYPDVLFGIYAPEELD